MKERKKQTVSVDETLKQRNADSDLDSGPQASGCCRLITDECDKDECCPIDQGVASFSGVSSFVGSPRAAPPKAVKLERLQTGASQSLRVPER
jgi:hypothetical protein